MTARLFRQPGPAFRRRLLLLVVAGLPVLLPQPAAAHGLGTGATNFLSEVTDAPDVAAVRWEVRGGDEFLQVTTTGTATVLVSGYGGEPYLEIGPRGVRENVRSPAAFLNRDRQPGQVVLPDGVEALATPEWVMRSDVPTWAWLDHRIHWTGESLPAEVLAASGAVPVTVRERWEVPVTIDGDDAVVAGRLRWVPGPSAVPWLAVAAGVLVALLLAVHVVARRSARSHRSAIVPTAAGVVAAVVVLNCLHLIDLALGAGLPDDAAASDAALLATVLVGCLLAAARGRVADRTGWWALVIGSVVLAWRQGYGYLGPLTATTTGSALPDVMLRTLVAASLLQLLLVGALLLWRPGGQAAIPRAG